MCLLTLMNCSPMKSILNYLFASLLIIIVGSLFNKINAQEKSTAQGLGLYVFPADGQTKEQQAADELECYNWAKEQTGVDPISPPQIEAEEVDTSRDGSGVRGAARGAAAGAAIGAIAGDAGKGAAIGAVAGGLKGRRDKRGGDQAEQAGADEAAAQQSQELLDNFNKAFTACLTGKGYTVQ